MLLNADELDFLADLASEEARHQTSDRELAVEHQAARGFAKKHDRPVRGVCPTFFHDPRIVDGHEPEIDAVALEARLRAKAVELRAGGPYR